MNYSALPNDNVSVNVTDIDVVGFTITESAGSSTVSETGTTDTFTIELDTIPTGNVVIDLSSADTAEVTVSPASLTFTTSDWNTPQTVTLTGQSDNSDDGDQAIAITAAINTGSTADTQYDGVSPQNFNATVTDIDTASFTVTQPSNVSETGTTSTFTVVLDLLPTANVTIDVSSNDTGEATVSPASLTFTTGDWSTAQTVTVTGVDDDVDDDNQNTTIEVNPNNGSADAQYGALATQNVYVTTTDDDSAGFTLAETGGSTSVNESGTSDTFTVVLDTEPTGNVVFDLTSANTAEMTVSPASLTFLTGNWNAAQTVTVTGVDDADDDDDQTVSVSVAINTGFNGRFLL